MGGGGGGGGGVAFLITEEKNGKMACVKVQEMQNTTFTCLIVKFGSGSRVLNVVFMSADLSVS